MTKAMKCAIEIAKWVGKNELQLDLCIYVDHKRFTVNDKGELVLDLDEAEPGEYFEFHGDFLSMSFEGPLYNIMNNYNDFIPNYDDKKQVEFNRIIAKYGKYYELGNAWNLSLYNM